MNHGLVWDAASPPHPMPSHASQARAVVVTSDMFMAGNEILSVADDTLIDASATAGAPHGPSVVPAAAVAAPGMVVVALHLARVDFAVLNGWRSLEMLVAIGAAITMAAMFQVVQGNLAMEADLADELCLREDGHPAPLQPVLWARTGAPVACGPPTSPWSQVAITFDQDRPQPVISPRNRPTTTPTFSAGGQPYNVDSRTRPLAKEAAWLISWVSSPSPGCSSSPGSSRQ